MTSKPKIEAIYPLTFMQQALLFHHLHEVQDQGFLQVQCSLHGPLVPEKLRESWQQAIARHAALRTSVHWKDIEKPVQIVHPQANLPWRLEDWRTLPDAALKENFLDLKVDDEMKGMDLTKPPLSRVVLVQVADEEFWLLWSCHHLLLDGWSAGVILRDVFTFYDANCRGQTANVEAVPSYRAYLNWSKQQDQNEAAVFWKKSLAGFEAPVLLGVQHKTFAGVDPALKNFSFKLSAQATEVLQDFTRSNRITLNTLIQGLWALLLFRFSGKNDVIFGTTVSGRSAGFPNMDLMAGMFLNILPVRIRAGRETTLADYFFQIQPQQSEAREHGTATLDEIMQWAGWPGHLPLFDHLLVVENFPWSDLEGGGVEVRDFEGGLTSAYPLTLVVKPGQQLEFLLKYKPGSVSESLVKWLSENLQSLLGAKELNSGMSLGEILQTVQTPVTPPDFEANGQSPAGQASSNGHIVSFVAPRNPSELQLAGIWEKILGLNPVGVKDNFFELGGTSLLAVRLFAAIQKQTGRNLPPVMLLQNPTIEALAKILYDQTTEKGWDSLVPLQVSGDKPPLFCVHGGGGHVMFYHPLAKRLAPDQPVYALQPVGLDGDTAYHASIVEMAAHYLREIRSVQPEGPYALLGYCQSTAVCHEMTKQLQANGEDVSLLALVDAAPERFEPVQHATVLDRAKDFTKRFLQNPVYAVTHFFENRKVEIDKKQAVQQLSEQDKALLRMQQHLRKLYEQYKWEPHEGKVTFIRCGEFEAAENGDWFIPKWQALAFGGVEVVNVPGRHLTLFEEPEVAGLAEALREKMKEKNFFNKSCGEEQL
jgi:thioesterase domain-containing protein/acyl carrier protein